MFKKIMVPIDLAHIDALERSMKIAADLARHYDATVHYVGVTGSGPGATARNADDFDQQLQSLANKQKAESGIDVSARTIVSNDVTVELDAKLREACLELEADLVVVGSHVPGFSDYILTSHGGSIASHAKVSVFVVR